MIIRNSCPDCGSKKLKKNGHIHTGKQNHQCRACGRQFVAEFEQRIVSDDDLLCCMNRPRGKITNFVRCALTDVFAGRLFSVSRKVAGSEQSDIGHTPDAVVDVERADGSRATVALEYYTAKYTDQMIAGKGDFGSAYDELVAYADTAATASRVQSILGGGVQCRVL